MARDLSVIRTGTWCLFAFMTVSFELPIFVYEHPRISSVTAYLTIAVAVAVPSHALLAYSCFRTGQC